MECEKRPVLVVGGGLGGLSVALALGQAGRRVQVLEQAREISAIGYGIQLGPNVFKVFDRLGITAQVKAACDFPRALVMPDASSGEVLMRIPLDSPTYQQRFEHPYVVIHRSDIHEILLEACNRNPDITLTVNATVDDVHDLGSAGVQATCADGRVFEGDALIGADGIKSRVRGLLTQERPPRETGYVAHRTLIDIQDVPPGLPHQDGVVLWSGPGYHMIHYPLRHGTLFNLVAVFQVPEGARGDTPEDYRAQAWQVFADAHPVLKEVLARMDLDRRWSLSDRDPFRPWSRGRITLLGDAVHPTLQSYAQGAGMALEDAVCLADVLQETGFDYERAFTEYPRRRLVRSARIQLGSRQLWEFYHAGGIPREVRNAELKERRDSDYYDCLGWIWHGDPAVAR